MTIPHFNPNSQHTHRHLKRGTYYRELGRGELQSGQSVAEGCRLVVYQGDDGRLWLRPEAEFDDGRFMKLPADGGSDTPSKTFMQSLRAKLLCRRLWIATAIEFTIGLPLYWTWGWAAFVPFLFGTVVGDTVRGASPSGQPVAKMVEGGPT